MSRPDGDLDYDYQVGFYLVAARHLYPNAKRIKVTFAYIAQGWNHTTEWTLSRDRYFRAAAVAIYRQIDRQNFDPRVSDKCKFCDFKRSCDAFQRWEADTITAEPNAPTTLTDDELLSLRNQFARAAITTKKRREELDAEIKARTPKGRKTLQTENWRANIITVNRKGADATSVRAVASALDRDALEVFEEVATVSHAKLKKVASASSDALVALQGSEITKTTTTVKVREQKI